MTQRIHLHDEVDLDPFLLAQLDEPVQDLFPVRVAREVVIGATLTRTICSMSSGERRRDFFPCTLMIVQNEHWNGQPRPASKLVTPPAVRHARSAVISGIGVPSMPGRSPM
jgi:hypothetical protein